MKVAGPILCTSVYYSPLVGTVICESNIESEPTSGLEPPTLSHYEWQGHTRHTSHERFPRVIGRSRESFTGDPRDDSPSRALPRGSVTKAEPSRLCE
jgi:hypothetical protein